MSRIWTEDIQLRGVWKYLPVGNWQVEPIGVGVDIRSRGVWKYLPSGKLAGTANRSPAELRAWAVAQCGSGWSGRGRWRRMDGAAFKGACPSGRRGI